jgi:hypothetical protein
VRGRLLGCLGEQQPGCLERLAHPAGGVESRREREGDGVQVDRVGRDPRAGQEGRDPGSRIGPEPLQTQPRDRPVLAHDRRDVGHGAERRKVGQVQRDRAQEQMCHLERDAAAGQTPVGIARVGPVRVDDRQGRRKVRRDAVVVGDDDIDAALPRQGDLDS